ncbi:inovirus-type Gp2 protein [Neptuniibacter sp. QD37_6]|uniref:YagK/YfjJ domain-containing protein n=1 Tax=Neptuniibacter sp. QD37_6 TaxID=3398210 RepID=UPI0039F5DFD2
MNKINKGVPIMINGVEYHLPDSKAGKGHYAGALDTIQGQFDAMLSYHCKMLVVRVDLKMKYFTESNKMLSDFWDALKRPFASRLNQNRFGYIWCREMGESGGHHYHVVLLLDGNKHQTSYKIIEIVEEIWMRWGQPKPYTPKNCYYMVQRGDTEAYLDAFNRASYLAKVATKEGLPPRKNKYNGSRLKPKVDLGVAA